MFLDRVRELISGSGGDRLISADELASGALTGSLIASAQTYLAAPPAPVDVTATAAVRSIFVEWDAPAYTGHAYAEVWGASTNSLAAAVLLGMAPGSIYVDETGSSATRYYWVRFVNTDDVKGPYNATSGATATTIPELEYTMDVLAKEYGDTSEAPFFQLPNPLVIDGVTIAAGTYMKAAYIYNGVITNAKIGNLAVDDAKISSLSVGKLTAGSIAADQYIQSSNYVAGTSGFRLDANGNAYLENAVVRGTVNATDGQFKGTLLGGSATSYTAGTGFFSGLNDTTYGWRVGSPTGARIQWTGTAVEVYNASNTLTMSSGGTPASAVTGLGAFATLNQITPTNVGTYIADAAITNAKIGNTIQSVVFNTGVEGWQIQKSGAAEFNDVVISRPLQVDSGDFYVGDIFDDNSDSLDVRTTFFIETNTLSTAWSGPRETYLALVGRKSGGGFGLVYALPANVSSQPQNILWGWEASVVPMTRWSGTQRLFIKVEFYTRLVDKITGFTLTWRLYKVT
jgi:hypothetical protein